MTPRKIIIQDTDLETANSLRTLLGTAGYTLITIKSRKLLPSLIKSFKPDLLVIESNINDKEAKAILAAIRKDLNIKIVATMCDGRKTYLLDQIGFDDCLSKPFNLEEVQEVIKKQLAA